MTTQTGVHTAAPSPDRREQYVAALLVGAVVTLLGFASGLGVSSGGSAGAATPDLPMKMTTSPSPSATSTPIHYIAVPEPNPGGGGNLGGLLTGGGTSSSPTLVVLPSTTATSPHPTSTGTTSTTPSTSPSTTPPQSCTPDLLGGLLSAVNLDSILGAGSGIPSTDNLFQLFSGGLPLGQLTQLLNGGGILSIVTSLISPGSLLASEVPTTASRKAVAASCTGQLDGILSAIGGLQ